MQRNGRSELIGGSQIVSAMRYQFNLPVSIKLGRLGLIRNVTSVREAAECLLSIDWPKVGRNSTVAKKVLKAAQVLLAAQEGRATEVEAREAFEAAAKAAGILASGWGNPAFREGSKHPMQR
ncbi:Protein of unknown function [Devosia enhydra]|uniref:DUF982 domain-containing protein n=1 Tax=Devosia enhydra TaxID=665118 RepID=A0A1K2HT13_9HYPH|nr:DUF982 domain-containing protein [Devosia enhydra]SFZ80801.1 Protein of unknown function [Devosia enhydra]